MSTATAPLQRALVLRSKYFLSAFIGLTIAYVLYHNEGFLVHPQDPAWTIFIFRDDSPLI
jgi:hypothetical protein